MDTPPQSQSAGTLHRKKRKPCAAPQNGSPSIKPSARSVSPRAQSPLSQSASEPIGARPTKRARTSEDYIPQHEDTSPSTKKHEQLNGLETQAQITRGEGIDEPGDPQHPAAYNHTPSRDQSTYTVKNQGPDHPLATPTQSEQEHTPPEHEQPHPLTKKPEQSNDHVDVQDQPKHRRADQPHEQSHSPLSEQSPIHNEDLPETDCLHQSESLVPAEAEKETTSPVDPISHWARTQAWPGNFASLLMSSEASSKRPRTESQSGQSGSSYARGKENGEPEQYTPRWENLINARGLITDVLQGEGLVSAESKQLCLDLQIMRAKEVTSSIYPNQSFREVFNLLQIRNEAIVQRDITPMLVPPVPSLAYDNPPIKHLADEVNAPWSIKFQNIGPRPQPDVAIGLTRSSFTASELEKLELYNRQDNLSNWTQVTDNLFFPFLMCEVKCNKEVLDWADRQNMNSCSIAVRSILRLVQEADEHRKEKELPKLSGKILAFSVSHDLTNARIYGYYAVCATEPWTYYRFRINEFRIFFHPGDVLAAHNFVRNVLKEFAPVHLKRLQDAIAALPLPEPPITAPSPSSSGVSEEQSVMSEQDDGAFKKPFPPQNGKKMTAAAEMRNQISALLQQLQEKEERALLQERRVRQQEGRVRQQEGRARQQEEKAQQQMDSLLRQLEQQREDNQRQMEQLRQDNQRLTAQLMEHFQRQRGR